MKRFAVFVLIFLSLLFNMSMLSPLAATNDIKEGLYKASELKLEPNNNYTIQNVSTNDSTYVLIFNTNNVVEQSLRLEPKSQKYNLSPIEANYRILVVGGDVSIS